MYHYKKDNKFSEEFFGAAIEEEEEVVQIPSISLKQYKNYKKADRKKMAEFYGELHMVKIKGKKNSIPMLNYLHGTYKRLYKIKSLKLFKYIYFKNSNFLNGRLLGLLSYISLPLLIINLFLNLELFRKTKRVKKVILLIYKDKEILWTSYYKRSKEIGFLKFIKEWWYKDYDPIEWEFTRMLIYFWGCNIIFFNVFLIIIRFMLGL